MEKIHEGFTHILHEEKIYVQEQYKLINTLLQSWKFKITMMKAVHSMQSLQSANP